MYKTNYMKIQFEEFTYDINCSLFKPQISRTGEIQNSGKIERMQTVPVEKQRISNAKMSETKKALSRYNHSNFLDLVQSKKRNSYSQ